METLQLTDVAPSSKRMHFWRRQFRPEITGPQIGFDVALGMIGPVLCFVFDPIVFRAGFDGPMLPDYQTFVYLFSGAQIVVLGLWLVMRPAHPVGSRVLAGAMLGGAIFCAVIGVVLTPLSLLGLMFGIGIFGFTPFVTAFVYTRNAVRGLRTEGAQSKFENGILLAGGFLLALILPLVLSLAIHSAVTQAVNEVIHGDAQQANFAAQRLVPIRFFAEAELNKIADAYLSEQDPQKQAQLRTLYFQITGDDLEIRARRLRD